ncbi:MAG: hypothetical protein ACYDA8_22030, partial [Deferrisomatales bacterium]
MITRRIAAVALLAAWGAAAGAQEPAAATQLEALRQRLRAEAGSCEVSQTGADLPMVSVTVLPGDTHARLAEDLTGSRDAEAVLRKIEPRLAPGQRLYVPRALLSPRLGDPRLEPVTLGQPYPTLWRLGAEGTVTEGPGVPATVRNLQRLNAILDPTRLPPGARVLVPRSLLLAGRSAPPPVLRIRTEHRVTDLAGLERRPRAQEFPEALRTTL